MSNAAAQKIKNLIEPSLNAMGFNLVTLYIVGTSGRPTVQILAERIDKERISVDDCTEISRTVSALLDVEDPISGAYMLEVSSPGMDRPLVKLEDFIRFKGFETKVEAPFVMENRKRFQGEIVDLIEDIVHIKAEDGICYEIPFQRIEKAKLVLNDKLLNAYKNKEI